jgi:hypothetical protein
VSAIAAELDRWAEHLAAEVGATGRWRFAGPLPIAVEVRDDGIDVSLGEWMQRFDDDDDGAFEALELVACGLFGLARAEVHTVGDRWIRFAVQFSIEARWSTHATLQRTHLAVWRRPSVALLENSFTPPEGLRLGALGRHPTAPWIGALDDAVAGAGPRELVVDGELDLHPFSPKEVADVVRAYLDACLDKGVHELRIVHGKGIGNLRRTVHALLEKHPDVESFRLGGMGEGSWGATLVTLRRRV